MPVFHGESVLGVSVCVRLSNEVIITGDEVEHGKPAPDIYLHTAEKLGISADACLVVEDALPGVAAAKAAKMRVAAIPDTRFVNARKYENQSPPSTAGTSR